MPDPSEAPVIAGSHGTAEAKRSDLARLLRSIPIRLGIVAVIGGVLFVWVQVYREAIPFERAAYITGAFVIAMGLYWFIKSRAERNDALIADRDHDLIPDDVDPDVVPHHHSNDGDPFA